MHKEASCLVVYIHVQVAAWLSGNVVGLSQQG